MCLLCVCLTGLTAAAMAELQKLQKMKMMMSLQNGNESDNDDLHSNTGKTHTLNNPKQTCTRVKSERIKTGISHSVPQSVTQYM